MEKFQFLPLPCPTRNAIYSKVFNEFSKTFFRLKEAEGGYCGWKFHVHRHFALPCPSSNAIYSKVFNEFSKTFFRLQEAEGGYCGWKFHVHRHFAFAITTLPLFQHPENVKISIFPFRRSQQKCWIFKSI